MRLLTFVGRCIVALLNLLFMIKSLFLITLGAIAYKASEVEFIKDIEKTIKSSLNSLSSSIGDSNSGINTFSITEFLTGLALALILSGVVLFFLSFVGCCGACYKFKTLILIYVIIISILLLGQVTVVVLMYAVPSAIQGSLKDILLKSLKDFQGIGGSDVTTLGWLFVMDEMDCCGVNGYTDFSNSITPDWDRTPANVVTQIDAPLVCCKRAPASSTDINCALKATLDINEKAGKPLVLCGE